MPIKFRCVYCNQLLGISRRKAGAVVRCKTCDGQLVVPDPTAASTELAEDGLPDDGSATRNPPAEKIFERDDFDKLLEPFQFHSMPAAAVKFSPPRQETPASASRPSGDSTPAPIMLDRRQLTWAIVLLVLGLGLAFAVGLWLGLSLQA